MNKPTIRAGIVGSGFAARFHYKAIGRVYGANVDVRGAWSPTDANREEFCAQRGLKSFETLEELLGECDVVHVCSPASTHEPVGTAILRAGAHAIIEKPFTGYFGDGSDGFNGDTFPREDGVREAAASISRLLEAERNSKGNILYAENWVYAPAVQKEREVIEKTGAQVLWMHGEESHSGSHSPYYGMWEFSGGGSLMGKSVHPLTAALYLKKVEGRARSGRPIRPVTVSARVHAITRSPQFEDLGHIRTGYTDIEDFGAMHVVFEDDTVADILASELKMGGVHNWLEVVSNTHRTTCNINPNNSMATYSPSDDYFKDIYTVEKGGTKEGWAFTSPDEDWFHGYQHEIEALYGNVIDGSTPESDSLLAADTIATVYSAYLSAERSGAEVRITF